MEAYGQRSETEEDKRTYVSYLLYSANLVKDGTFNALQVRVDDPEYRHIVMLDSGNVDEFMGRLHELYAENFPELFEPATEMT